MTMQRNFFCLLICILSASVLASCSSSRDLTSYYLARDVIPKLFTEEDSTQLEYQLLYQGENRDQGQLDMVSYEYEQTRHLVFTRALKTVNVRINEEPRLIDRYTYLTDRQLSQIRDRVRTGDAQEALRQVYFVDIEAEQAKKLAEGLERMKRQMDMMDRTLARDNKTRSLHHVVNDELLIQMRSGEEGIPDRKCLVWIYNTQFEMPVDDLEATLKQFMASDVVVSNPE